MNMAIKPTLLPISPNDARAAIRLHNTLESDIARLREDLRRHTCDPLSAQQAIAHKQRQIAQVRAFLRQYQVDLEQFDRREEERRRQAQRKQHAIFEDQRRAAVPGKNSIVARRARSMPSPPEIALPAPVPVPPASAPKARAQQPAAPINARAFTPQPPATGNPAELAKLRREQEAMLKTFQDQMNAVRADLAAKNAVIMRGSQAQREQLLALQQQVQAQQEIQRRMSTDVANYAKNDVNQQKFLLEKMSEQQKAYQHEIKMIQANLTRLAKAAAAEEKMKKEQEAAKRKAMAEEKKKRDAEEQQKKREIAEAQKNLNASERSLSDFEKHHQDLKMRIQQIDTEMQHAKVSNPQMAQQLSVMRGDVIQEMKIVEREMGPLRADVQMLRKTLKSGSSNLGGMDTTAGLRAWHRDLLTTTTARQVPEADKKMLKEMLAKQQVPQHLRDQVWNAVAKYESGCNVSIDEEVKKILGPWKEAQKQEQAHAAALGGTKRFIQHGKASVAQNNYYRMRAIQQTEDAGKEAQNAASQQQAQKATDLSGMFPQLRSAVGRMVGN